MLTELAAEPVWRIYFTFWATVLGAVFGSFLNCAAWRIARGESFVTGRSRCPDCGHTLGAAELVPILSWLWLRGRCRSCGSRISVRYPLTELLFAAVCGACVWRFGPGIEAARDMALLGCLLVLSLVDLEKQEIPDGCLIAAALVWAACAPFLCSGWRDALRCVAAGLTLGGGMLALSLVMDKVLGRESLGGGDVKLFAVVGLYLGFVGGMLALILSCVLGLLLAAALRTGKGEPLPFGPAIAAATALTLLFGRGPIEWYLGLLGW